MQVCDRRPLRLLCLVDHRLADKTWHGSGGLELQWGSPWTYVLQEQCQAVEDYCTIQPAAVNLAVSRRLHCDSF